ncbi:MAG: hypothetical protein K5682_01495 [Lachnospiraceae bacterium]|nr:hypothetical protein [Lachnospiraceae bacterium]
MTEERNTKKKPTMKQIAAIVCIVILVLLYIVTLIAAIFDRSAGMRMFSGCLVATIGLPILLWIYLLCYGYYTKKHTIADLDILRNTNLASSKEEPENDPDSTNDL